jgi:hypothetical protein
MMDMGLDSPAVNQHVAYCASKSAAARAREAEPDVELQRRRAAVRSTCFNCLLDLS